MGGRQVLVARLRFAERLFQDIAASRPYTDGPFAIGIANVYRGPPKGDEAGQPGRLTGPGVFGNVSPNECAQP